MAMVWYGASSLPFMQKVHGCRWRKNATRDVMKLDDTMGNENERSNGTQKATKRKKGQQLPAAHVELITSVANPFVKHAVKLRQNSSYRHEYGHLVVVGEVPIREICDVLLLQGNHAGQVQCIDCLFLTNDVKATTAIMNYAQRVIGVTASVMHKLSGVKTAGGVEAVGIFPFPCSFCNLNETETWFTALSKCCPRPRRLLVLDMIQDPGNLGTLLRTAAAFAWDGVFLINNCCDPFNEKALRAAQGACFRIPIAIGIWSQLQIFANKHNMKLYAAQPEHDGCSPASHQQVDERNSFKQSDRDNEYQNLGCFGSVLQSLSSIADEEALCLVLGSEGQGLSEQVRESCTPISLPMPGAFESLNVAVAGGILLFALQRNWKR